MEAREVLDLALQLVGGNQAELARRLGRSETTVSRWVTGRNGIDFESALRLAKITTLPARQVIEACGLDPELIPPEPSGPPTDTEWARFVAGLETRWRAMDRATREWAEQTAEFVFSVPPTGAQDHSRRRTTDPRRSHSDTTRVADSDSQDASFLWCAPLQRSLALAVLGS